MLSKNLSQNLPLIDDDDEDSDELRQDNSNPPGILITQQLDGVEAGEDITTNKIELDEQNSQIYGTSVYANYVEGKSVGKAKNTDDKIVTGYTSDGLPFQIVVDGFYGNGNTKAIFEFIKQHVTPLMDNYAEKLSQSENPEETIKNLIRTIYALRETYSPDSDFTMSIGITYKKDNKLHCAGFGIGDTGLVLRKSSGKIQQLTYTTSVNDFKDAFDSSSVNNAGIERVINRNSVFDVPVNSGDEIFGYTYLCDDLLSEEKEKRSEERYKVKARGDIIIDKTDSIFKYKLNIDQLDGSGSLFNDVKKTNNKLFIGLCDNAKQSAKTENFGDDCMMGTVTIPTLELQNKLKENVYTQEIKRLKTQSVNETNNDIREKGKKVHADAVELKKTETNLPKLTRYLSTANRALINRTDENINSLMSRAENAQGAESIGEKAIGIGMMALGVGLFLLGSLVVVGGFITLPIAIGAVGLPVGAGIAAGGAVTFSSGLGLFIHGSHKGISKNMSELGDELKHNPKL